MKLSSAFHNAIYAKYGKQKLLDKLYVDNFIYNKSIMWQIFNIFRIMTKNTN